MPGLMLQVWGLTAPRASNERFVIMEKATTRAFSWLKVSTSAFTFKTADVAPPW